MSAPAAVDPGGITAKVVGAEVIGPRPVSGAEPTGPRPGSVSGVPGPPSAPEPRWHRLLSELERLADDGATGALRVGDEGTFYLREGAITFAKSVYATDLTGLVTGSGEIAPDEWHRAYDLSGGDLDALAGALSGRLGRAELEASILIGIFDAAYFLLQGGPPSAPCPPAEFHRAARHGLEPICRITPATLARETDRRRARLGETWPSPVADHAPVAPVRHVRRPRVALTGLQAELLFNADRRRTPVELGRELGRPAYSCLLAVRSLVAAGLVSAPNAERRSRRLPQRRGAGTRPAQVGTAGSADRADMANMANMTCPADTVDVANTINRTNTTKTIDPVGTADPVAAMDPAGTADSVVATDLAGRAATGGNRSDARWAPVDEALLLRLHDALKALT